MNEWLFMGCAVWEIAQKRERETCVHVDNEPHDTYVFVDSEICLNIDNENICASLCYWLYICWNILSVLIL